MLIYLVVFFFSILFTYIAERSIAKNRKQFIAFSVLSVGLPVLLSGLRDNSVGTDTEGYVAWVWNIVSRCSDWDSFLHLYHGGYFADIEFGYLMVNFVANVFSNDVHSVYFLTGLLSILPIYIAIYHYRAKVPMWLSMAIFLLTYYNLSLNLTRQSIALAFCIYAFRYVEQRRWFKLVVMFIVILGFHNTGFIFIPAVVMFLLMEHLRWRGKIIFLLACFVSLMIAFRYVDVLLFASVTYGLLPEKFLYYQIDEMTGFLSRSNFIVYIFESLLMLMVILSRASRKMKSRLFSYFTLKCIGVYSFTLSTLSMWAFRISYYFNFPADCLFLPSSLNTLRQNGKTNLYRWSLVLLISLLLFNWYFNIVIKNANETYPYKSSILGI
ncbi:EpsG family protein [Bacteroides sp. An51A]|uniref:EpsG family protein n=1 Tax=Bacteroides sp. An51A TaxID=1965640 RepID=UPI000B3AC03F|nr:EpsG family protein [Bacteroides sp. An51A]OUN79586.1 hypothetical protein B5G04_12260 [Bacteroides sp. An51A]